MVGVLLPGVDMDVECVSSEERLLSSQLVVWDKISVSVSVAAVESSR